MHDLRQIAKLMPKPDRSEIGQIAESIDEDPDLAPESEKHFLGNVIVMHVYGDYTYTDVLPSQPGISLRNNFSTINLPNGDIVYLAKTLDDLKNNVDIDDMKAAALFNAGLIDTDDDGNFLI